ncbi:MAG TPA: hypothetical protein VL069_09030 [Opitutus sp.]|nr:hypothetical protein [Opitutus sp.]
MRFFLFACFLNLAVNAAEPSGGLNDVRPVLEEAIKTFRTEGPKGWSFTQTTRGDGHSRVERYDATQPEFNRWILLQQDDRTPTADELRDYREKLSRRSCGGTAPLLTDQLDLTTLVLENDSVERATLRARLKPGEAGDATGEHLVATVILHKPSRTIESFELAAVAPFSPMIGVKITAMKTVMTYSLPNETRPSLLQTSATHLRGKAYFFKSLDADMTVTFTDYESVRRQRKQ